jgi:P27 family predicted phage terminase small subunit
MGGRPKKIVELSTKHRSKAETDRREYEQSLLSSSGTDLDDVRASQFVNTTAGKEYRRVLKRLREETGVIGNLNKSDLINYANSYGRYMDFVKECRKKGFQYVVETRNGPKPNPIIRMMDEARRDMAESSRRLGMTLDGQLKAAKAKADKEEAEMEAVFGVI